MVVLVFVAGAQAVDVLADQDEQRMRGILAAVVEGRGDLPDEISRLVELPHQQLTGFTGQSTARVLDRNQFLRVEADDFIPDKVHNDERGF